MRWGGRTGSQVPEESNLVNFHQQQTRSVAAVATAIGVGRFLGVLRILPEFSQICPKNL